MKEQDSTSLTLSYVYAAGFISMTGGKERFAAGLYGGWAGGTSATNAYAAMHYIGTTTIYPLAAGLAWGQGSNCYWLNYPSLSCIKNVDGEDLTYEQMSNQIFVNKMGYAFEKKTVADSHPYNLDGGSRSAYPFPSLKGLPHYGDWYVPEKTVMAEPPLEEAGPGPEAGPLEQSAETGGAVEGEPSEAAPPAGDITAAEQGIPAGEPGAPPPDTSGGRSGRSVTKRDP